MKKRFEQLKREGYFDTLVPGEIEMRIRPLVDKLNRLSWCATYSSCGGHEYPKKSPYVGFFCMQEDHSGGHAFLMWLKQEVREPIFYEVDLDVEPVPPEILEVCSDPLVDVVVSFHAPLSFSRQQAEILTERIFPRIVRSTS